MKTTKEDRVKLRASGCMSQLMTDLLDDADRLRELEIRIQALVDRLTDWQCAKDECAASMWPELLIKDPEQWCLNAIRALGRR